MRVSIVVAMSSNNVIGKENDLPWRGKLPADMKRFVNLTMGHPVIMGRKTYDSIPLKFRPLPGRTNIVLSRSGYAAPGCTVLASLRDVLEQYSSEHVFILGGGQVYIAALPFTDDIYLTLIHEVIEGDTRFPSIDQRVWKEIENEHEDHEPDEKNKFRYSFIHLIRR